MLKKTIGLFFCLPFYGYFKLYEFFYYKIGRFLHHKKGLKLLDVKYKETDSNIFIDVDDTGITKEILTINVKEPLNTGIMKEILKNNKIDNIIDLGANIGDFVLLENQYCKANILAIEPVGRIFEVLKLNMLRNNLEDKVSIKKVGAGDRNGFSKIFIPKQGNWSSLYKSKFTESADTEKIEIQTLEKLFKENNIPLKNVLIRTDIEGFEYNLIKGNKGFLKKVKNLWFCLEFHNQILDLDKCIEFMKIMEEIGFKIKIMSNEGPLWLSFL